MNEIKYVEETIVNNGGDNMTCDFNEELKNGQFNFLLSNGQNFSINKSAGKHLYKLLGQYLQII